MAKRRNGWSKQKRAYEEYIQSDAWKKLRREKIESGDSKCAILNVHHIRYKNLTDYVLSDLMVLCKNCHDTLHKAGKKFQQNLKDVELDKVKQLINDYAAVVSNKDRKLSKKELGKLKSAHWYRKVREMRTIEDVKYWSFKSEMRSCVRNSFSYESLSLLLNKLNAISGEVSKAMEDRIPKPDIASIISEHGSDLNQDLPNAVRHLREAGYKTDRNRKAGQSLG